MITLPQDLTQESIRLLQGLLRCDTQSPPGNEARAAAFIRAELAKHDIPCEFLEAAPGRVTVVARLFSENPVAKPLLLMGHIDVVTVDAGKWDRDPFGGELDDDGFIWGRGALDMKGMVAGELAAFIAIKQAGVPLDRDVIFCAFADEEAGGTYGADWVWKNHRDKIDAEFAINEGGGMPLEIGGKRFYTCQAGEKGGTRLRLTVRGKPGHASTPAENTAMSKLGLALERLHAWDHPTVITATVRMMLESIGTALGGDDQERIEAILAQESPAWEELAQLPLPERYKPTFKAVTRNTAVPTMIAGGQQINVIPGEITIAVDGRLLPGADPEQFLQEAREAIGDAAEVDFLYDQQEVGVEADPQSSFFDAIQRTMKEIDPDGAVIPSLIAGGTDASLVPGVKVYGFFPMMPTERLAMYRPLVHSHNERVHVDDLAYGTGFIYRLVMNVAGPKA